MSARPPCVLLWTRGRLVCNAFFVSMDCFTHPSTLLNPAENEREWVSYFLTIAYLSVNCTGDLDVMRTQQIHTQV